MHFSTFTVIYSGIIFGVPTFKHIIFVTETALKLYQGKTVLVMIAQHVFNSLGLMFVL